MDKKKIESQLNEISNLMLDYEDGDLILLSDLLDLINNLKELFKESKEASSIINVIYNTINNLLNNISVNNADDIIFNGIDLLSRVIKSRNKSISDLLIDDINNYLKSVGNEDIKKEIKHNNFPGKKIDKTEDKDINLSSDSIKIFLTEANERMISSQEKIMELEDDLDNKSIINDLFRDFHTIKGECGFLKLIKLGETTHNLENLLDLLRYDEIKNNSDVIDILLKGIDVVFSMLKALDDENLDHYNDVETADLINSINFISETGRTPIGEILENKAELSKKDITKIIKEQKEKGYTKKFGEIAVDNNYITKDQLEESLNTQKKEKQTGGEKILKNDPIIKVKASQINYLVDMIGELLIAENQLEDDNIILLRKITKQIQNAAMMLRTVKVKNLFINMKRVVRDLAKKLDKQIDFKIIGEDLEIDRNLVEALEEPLIHILRNALGHGIEYKNERIKNKKNETGEIILKAERQGNNIVISIRDDGRGLNKEKILKKAISMSLVNEDNAKQLKESEVFGFIFNTGFSTADNVDNVSGRGVGMDIVKSTVSRLRGKIEINSELNHYTEINLIFPLSMAIIDGMIVGVRSSYFIIPVSNIIESLSLEDNMIYSIKNKETVIDLRGEIIPVIKLENYFNIFDDEKINNNEYTVAVIIESSNRKYAFIVDEIIAKKEIVIKSLGEKFKNLKGISSGTVLSGGKIGLVLNIEEVVDLSGIDNEELVMKY